MASTAAAVRDYINARPAVREAIVAGIVNHSALARIIQTETGQSGHDAVLAACRRYKPTSASHGRAVRAVLDACRLEVRTRVGVATIRPSWRLMERLEKDLSRLRAAGPVHLLHGSSAITLIAPDEQLEAFVAALDPGDVIKARTGLVELNLQSPETVEEVPGILALVAGTLSGQDVNAIEVISCHKDNLFLIEAGDLQTAMAVLDRLLNAS